MVSFGGIARKLFGSANERRVRAFLPNVAEINPLEEGMRALTDENWRTRRLSSASSLPMEGRSTIF